VGVRQRMRQTLRGLEGKEAAAATARRGEKERRAGVGEEGDAEEGGEAREEVERRAAEQREDAVGRESFRVASHALPRRRRPPRHGNHPSWPHRHENRNPPRKLNAYSPARRATAWISPPGLDWVLPLQRCEFWLPRSRFAARLALPAGIIALSTGQRTWT
jgi:hypothetical protein